MPPSQLPSIPVQPGRVERGRQRLPNRRAVIAYWSFAHFSLATALLALVLWPESFAGFHYHPKMVAVVHLVTLGWVTCSIFGALHMVAPMALRSPVRPRPIDLWGFALVAIGIVGMVAHFWLDTSSGMAWSAGTVVAGFLVPVLRFWRAVTRATIPAEVKIHFYFAFANLGLAAGAGLALGIHKNAPFLPGTHLSNVWAHAHLAALGWATMMVFAVGYRLLPMFLPAAMPTGRGVWSSALLLEVGTLGLAVTLALENRWAIFFSLIVVSAFAAFAGRVVWMLRHRKPDPKQLIRPDWATVQALTAIGYLLISAVLGCALLIAPPAAWKIGAAMAFGTVFLIGFLAQMVVGVAGRLFPLATWLWSFADSDYQQPPPSPLAVTPRALQALVLGLWILGVPVLTLGLATTSLAGIRIGAVCLLLGTLASALAMRVSGWQLQAAQSHTVD